MIHRPRGRSLKSAWEFLSGRSYLRADWRTGEHMEDRPITPLPVVEDPIELLQTWRADAEREERQDPSAACLATVGENGAPAARMVLVKAIDARGLVFYTNTESRKGKELKGNPNAALVIHWPVLGRQVRIEGAAVLVSDEEDDRYFASRPRGSQISAWASAQSSVLAGGLEELSQQFEETAEQFSGRPVDRPSHWTGYRIAVDRIEFWRHRDDRLHERLRYVRAEEGWRHERLAP